MEFAPSGGDDIIEFAPTGADGADDILEFAPEESDNSSQRVLSVDEKIGQIREMGISVDDGMTYCAGDKEFYVDMLKEYIDSYEEKSQQLNKLIRTKEWSQ